MLASITRLRLRYVWLLLPFIVRASQSQKQALNTPGCLGVCTRKTRGLTFWTLSLWESEQSLRLFMSQGPHRAAIPKLHAWCDEASTAHWEVDHTAMPSWEVGTAMLQQCGRLIRVKYPSDNQKTGHINAT